MKTDLNKTFHRGIKGGGELFKVAQGLAKGQVWMIHIHQEGEDGLSCTSIVNNLEKDQTNL
jgi:hypothetical protein